MVIRINQEQSAIPIQKKEGIDGPQTEDSLLEEAIASTEAGEHQDTLQLTADANRLQKLEGSVQKSSGIDLDKVDKIKSQLEKQQFEADPETIAAKLILAQQQFDRLFDD